MFKVIEHTADIGLRIAAGDLNELFAEAARALASLLVENLSEVQPVVKLDFDLKQDKLEDLLVDWLSEVLHALDERCLVLSQFEVEVRPGGLRAHAAGEPLDLDRHRLGPEIKAVTYHGLVVRPTPEGWMAEVIVDL